MYHQIPLISKVLQIGPVNMFLQTIEMLSVYVHANVLILKRYCVFIQENIYPYMLWVRMENKTDYRCWVSVFGYDYCYARCHQVEMLHKIFWVLNIQANTLSWEEALYRFSFLAVQGSAWWQWSLEKELWAAEEFGLCLHSWLESSHETEWGTDADLEPMRDLWYYIWRLNA